jgi:nicotinamide riboside kinase
MKIGLVGSISVGKTTLIKSLSQLPQFKDYHTSVERSKYLRDLGIPLNTDSTILGQSVFLAERASELMNKNLLTDRTIIDVMAFTNLSQSMNKYEKDSFEMYAKNLISMYDYIFYISPEGVELEDNGVRVVDAVYRQKIDGEIRRLIRNYFYKIKYYKEISGSNEDRINQILEYLFF